jgi:tetratricopeptide (TPR) repeat protein
MRDIQIVETVAVVVLLLLAGIASPAASWAQEERLSAEIDEALEDALELFQEKQYSRAAHLYAVADELSGGTSFDALMGLARSHYALGRMGIAAEYAFQAMELGPPLAQRAEACMLIPEREKNVEMAAGFFRQAMQYASEASPDAWLHLAQSFELAGEADAAIKLYEAYLENDPEGEQAEEAKESLKRLRGE